MSTASGLFTGFVQAPATASASGVITGFVPGGWRYAHSSIPGVVWNGHAAASGVLTGHLSGFGLTPGARPASGVFTGFVHRTTSSFFTGFVVGGPLPTASGVLAGFVAGAVGASGVLTGFTPSYANASGLLAGYTHGFGGSGVGAGAAGPMGQSTNIQPAVVLPW